MLDLEHSSTKYFIWICWHNCVKIGNVLKNLGMDISNICSCSPTSIENIDHILKFCPHAIKIWSNIDSILASHFSPLIFNDKSINDWLFSNLTNPELVFINKSWPTVFSFTCWHHWKNHNSRLFHQKDGTDLSFHFILKISIEYINHYKGYPNQNNHKHQIDIKWNPLIKIG